jgi:hypothetical protein
MAGLRNQASRRAIERIALIIPVYQPYTLRRSTAPLTMITPQSESPRPRLAMSPAMPIKLGMMPVPITAANGIVTDTIKFLVDVVP